MTTRNPTLNRGRGTGVPAEAELVALDVPQHAHHTTLPSGTRWKWKRGPSAAGSAAADHEWLRNSATRTGSAQPNVTWTFLIDPTSRGRSYPDPRGVPRGARLRRVSHEVIRSDPHAGEDGYRPVQRHVVHALEELLEEVRRA